MMKLLLMLFLSLPIKATIYEVAPGHSHYRVDIGSKKMVLNYPGYSKEVVVRPCNQLAVQEMEKKLEKAYTAAIPMTSNKKAEGIRINQRILIDGGKNAGYLRKFPDCFARLQVQTRALCGK